MLNILQITTHDSGRHFGCYGHSTVRTPVIDRFAEDGVLFTNCFCTVPICSASRACQLTGLYPQSNGLMDLTGFGWRLGDDVRHASQILRSAGYHTLLFGIQHEVASDEMERLAFDFTRPQPNDAAGVADGVTEFLRREASSQQPFYAQVGFFETHTPFDRGGAIPDTAKGVEIPPYLADAPSSRETMAAFQGALRNVDAAVGRILEALRSSGLEENTLVIFTTDHGIEVPRAKWFLYDPGIAIALVMRCPAAGLTGGLRWDGLMSNVDYLPTVLEIANVKTPVKFQGLSHATALRAQNPGSTRDAVFGLYHKTQSRYVRTNRHKLIRHFDHAIDFSILPVRIEDVQKARVIPLVELFDLEADPNEFHNLAGNPAHSDLQHELETMLWRWMESVDDPLLRGPVRSPCYEASIGEYRAWKQA